MADEGGIRTEEGQDGVENRRTFSDMMEHSDEVQDPAASTHQETPEEKEAREAAEAEAAAAGDSEGETPEAKAAREAAEAEAAKPKFSTLEEWEKGYKEAETRMHTATSETATEKTAREAAEKRAEVAEAKLAEVEAETQRAAAEAAKPKVLSEDEQDIVFEHALSEIADLDRTDPDQKKQAARIWRKAIASAGDSRPLPDPEKIAEDAANRAWEKLQVKQAAESVKIAEDRKKEDAERTETKAKELGVKAGLDLDDPESTDSIIWDRMKAKIPQEVFDKGTLEAQVEWVSTEVRKRTAKVVQQTDAERKLAAEAQKKNTVMGKGLNFTPSKEAPKTKTLSEMY